MITKQLLEDRIKILQQQRLQLIQKAREFEQMRQNTIAQINACEGSLSLATDLLDSLSKE